VLRRLRELSQVTSTKKRLPPWLRRPVPHGEEVRKVQGVIRYWGLHTICESAFCPNRQECFSRGRVTFMILGDICTRNCAFCGVKTGRPLPPDPDEPDRLYAAAKELGLNYVVITSVCRDDLPDGGAAQFAQFIEILHCHDPSMRVEVLIPDFRGSRLALERVVAAQPTVLNHNVETVPRLYSEVRPQAKYHCSLEVLKRAKFLNRRLSTKSGLILGLGEREDEVIKVIEDLREADCDFITLGQYLRPSLRHREVVEYVTPEEFERYKVIGEEMGFLGVASGPLVRSSFGAEDMWQNQKQNSMK
jgi:lipoic acid synthetase